MFLKKWEKEVVFCTYCNEMWFLTHKLWYEQARNQTPCTNNALKALNLIVKNEHTFRERLPVGRFLHIVLDAAKTWSNEYKTG
jgi:hypothetical protein